jgi:hypothetical protein
MIPIRINPYSQPAVRALCYPDGSASFEQWTDGRWLPLYSPETVNRLLRVECPSNHPYTGQDIPLAKDYRKAVA